MPPGGDLLQGRRDRGATARGSDRRGGAHVHQIDHGDGRVRFGERADDCRERAGSESGTADIGRQHDSEEPGGTERFYRLRRKSALLVVFACCWSQHTIGNFFRA